MKGDQENSSMVRLDRDGETGHIDHLTFRSRALHRHLSSVGDEQRPALLLDALKAGAEILVRASEHGDLQNLAKAIERLDEESKRIIATTAERVERTLEKSVTELANTIQREDGPFATVLQKFDLAAEGNVIDLFRELVASAATKATRQAVKELSEASQEVMERLTKSITSLEKVAAADEARLSESVKGTAKGLDHEYNTETLLGELVGAVGDSLDDVSTVLGLLGTKKGDKVITPRNGCLIVTEEKCTTRLTESKARAILDEAKANRGAALALLIVDDESKVPGNQLFHLIDDDKAVVVAERHSLRLVYALFRTRAVEIARASEAIDDTQLAEVVEAIHSAAEEIKRSLERFRLLRTEHTKAAKAIGQASSYVDDIAATIGNEVVAIMSSIDCLLVDSRVEAA